MTALGDVTASGEPQVATGKTEERAPRRFARAMPPATVRATKSRLRRDLIQTRPRYSATESDTNRPIWLELHLELEEMNYDWFEGSISPWRQVDRPVVEWESKAAERLKLAGLTVPEPDRWPASLEGRVLALLPHLYSLGVNRVIQELRLTPDEEKRVELFPLIGFAPHPGDSIAFETLRMNVAVIDETIVTVRLPNLICPPDETRRRILVSGDVLNVPPRFFPGWDASALQVAEEVARHQAATTRALADHVREELKKVLVEAEEASDQTEGVSGGRLESEKQVLKKFGTLTRIAEMADRQLSRLLRRMGSYGENEDKQEPADIRRRYGFALDEVRALGREITSARDRHLARTETQRQSEREQFQFIAALIGSAILVPTLIAGIFGANVWVPGERHPEGFIALIAFIVAFATGGTWLIERAWKHGWRPPGKLRPVFKWTAIIAIVVGFTMLGVDAFKPERHSASQSADRLGDLR